MKPDGAALEAQRKVNELRRERRLRGMKERQYDFYTLHQLFRLFDRDKDRRLSVSDFQTGLVAMGYSEARDNVVVDRILKEIDLDRSGDITEEEFVHYFMQRRLEDLENKLNEISKEEVSSILRVMQYGALETEFTDSGVLDLNSENGLHTLQKLLKEPLPSVYLWSTPPRHWFEMTGFHQQTMSLFGQRYGLHEESMKDAGLFQHQKIEVLSPGPAADWVTDFNFPEAYVEETPLKRNDSTNSIIDDLPSYESISNIHCRRATSEGESDALERVNTKNKHCLIVVHELRVNPSLRECIWGATGELLPAPTPVLVKQQYTLFVFGDDAMLSVRKDSYDDVDMIDISQHELQTNESKIAFTEDDILKELRDRVKRGDADLRINSSSAKYLAFSAIEVVMESNYRIYDEL